MAKNDIKLLEDVQRRSTRLDLDLLSCGMDKGDMILVYEILHGFLEGVQWWNYFQMGDTSRL